MATMAEHSLVFRMELDAHIYQMLPWPPAADTGWNLAQSAETGYGQVTSIGKSAYVNSSMKYHVSSLLRHQ